MLTVLRFVLTVVTLVLTELRRLLTVFKLVLTVVTFVLTALSKLLTVVTLLLTVSTAPVFGIAVKRDASPTCFP